MIDLTDSICGLCGEGLLQETSIHDDIDGVLHCTHCHQVFNRYKEIMDD